MRHWHGAILSLLIIVLAFLWDSGAWVKWGIILAALVLFLKAMMHPMCMPPPKAAVKKAKRKPAKKKKKRKR